MLINRINIEKQKRDNIYGYVKPEFIKKAMPNNAIIRFIKRV